MANQEHLDILMRGGGMWNLWRQKHPEIQPDLSGANLFGIDLHAYNLSGANLREANLISSYLYEANLDGSDLREATKDLNSIACANLGQTGMIGKWFVQIIAKEPTDAESICCMTHQQAFGANNFKEHDELQLEEHNGVNGGTTSTRISLLHELTHEREIE